MNGLRLNAGFAIDSGKFALGIVKTHQSFDLLDCTKRIFYRLLDGFAVRAGSRNVHKRPHGRARAL